MSGGRYGPARTPERRCLPLALWPETDRELWVKALTPGTFLDDELGARAHHSTASNRKTEKGYGRYLTYCRLHVPTCLDDAPAVRISAARVRSYVLHLTELGNGSQSILCRLQELGDAARVMGPDGDWSFINRIAARVRARHVPVRVKNHIVLTDELAQLGFDLMISADELQDIEAAVRFRDGLMIALLAYVPLRRKNFTRLALGHSLVRRQGRWFIQLTPEETKTHAWFELALPEALEPWLGRYLGNYRPRLLARTGRWQQPAGDALWVSSHGSPITEIALYDRIRRRTSERFGAGVSPHLFRDAAASTLATEAPLHVRIAAPLLGHRSFQTTEKYYRQAKDQEGHKRYLQTLQELRRKVHD